MRRLILFLLATCLAGGSALAQESGEPSAPLNLPISLEKIREGLLRPQPAEPLKGLSPTTDAPTFHVDITEQQKFEELLAKIRWEPPGPQVAGGIYAYDQQERLFPRVNNPRVQPYGAFSGGEVTTLAVEALIEKYVAERMAHVVGTALREQAEREARDEVAHALNDFLAAHSSPSQ